MPDLSPYSTFKTRLVAGFALLIASLAALIAWKVYSDYSSTRAAAYTNTEGFARAMSAHVASEMRVVDLSLLRASEALGRLGELGLKDKARVRQSLALAASVADASFWVLFLDQRGVGVAASNNLAVAGVSYGDRLYFSSRVDKCDGGLYVGAPEVGRVSKRKLFFLSRAVCSPGGAFLGVVAAPIDASAIAKVFASSLF
jgi:hypothetical protein